MQKSFARLAVAALNSQYAHCTTIVVFILSSKTNFQTIIIPKSIWNIIDDSCNYALIKASLYIALALIGIKLRSMPIKN